MKRTLKMISTIFLTSVAINTINGCNYINSTKAPDLNCKYATLLGWYKKESTTSLIEQDLNYNDTFGNEHYAVAANNSLITVANLFKNKLLEQGSGLGKFKAQNRDAANFLIDLGFKSGDENQDYSKTDVDDITALTAVVTSTNGGKIEENGANDFQIGDGNCQIDIIVKNESFDKVITSYTINTAKNDHLKIYNITSAIIFNKSTLKLTAKQGFKQGEATNAFKLKFKNINKQKQFDSLVKLLNVNVSIEFFTDPNNQTSKINIFPSAKVYLEICFNNVKNHRIDCGIPTSE